MICAGVDAGSRTIKIVLLDADSRTVVASGIVDQGVEQGMLAARLFDQVIVKAGTDRTDVALTVATGYGREQVDIADKTFTEITCHARGVRLGVPEVRTVIDIGGQDSKIIRLDGDGCVHDFAMNDRCAAGTGRFLEMVASRLGVDVRQLGEMAERSKEPAPISSMCVVFAETEIVGLLASGVSPDDIVAGVQDSIATRITSMVARKAATPIIFTGGVALVSGMDRALASNLGRPVGISPVPQMTGALGAALLASEQASGS